MSDHLVVISLGPVQGFIAAGRRTRDLWFGSYVLSELGKAAALALSEGGAELIFPAPVAGTPEGGGAPEDLPVSNKIVAIVAGRDPRALSDAARSAVENRWLEIAEGARARAESLGVRIDVRRWERQIRDVLEFYAAWTAVEGSAGYAATYRRAQRLLSGRKALRDFRPAVGDWGVPKSSIDGALESVLEFSGAAGGAASEAALRRAGIKPGEHLDAVGVVKRLGAGLRSFPPVCRVAVDPWIRGLKSSASHSEEGAQAWAALKEVKSVAHRLQDLGLAPPIGEAGGDGVYQLFPFEGELLFPSRLNELKREESARVPEAGSLVDEIRHYLRPVWKSFGEPLPYLAILRGDGDRMGEVLSRLGSAEAHREFSARLSRFAREARKIVREQNGCLVYSGGDDVLAFLPVDTCVCAAAELRRKFGELVGNGVPGTEVTFSVGIVVGHYLQPLDELMDLAARAERDAKEPDRDGLAVWFQSRSGGEPTRSRARWPSKPEEWLHTAADYLETGVLPDRAAYDLRALAREYGLMREPPPGALRADAERVLRKKRPRRGRLTAQTIDYVLAWPDGGRSEAQVQTPEHLLRLADALILAGHIGAARRQAAGIDQPKGREV